MSSFASPIQMTAVAVALGWPLAAGLGVVIWSKARAAGHSRKTATVDAQLKDMFQSVESRGVPTRLALVVDALEEHEALKASADRAKAQTTRTNASA